MTNYWAMRTSKRKVDFIFEELKKGRLRQGWGRSDDLNLNVIKELLAKGKSLNEDQKKVWSKQKKMHPEVDDGIQKGDYILLPNLPKIGQWSIAKVMGGYSFEIDPTSGNYGHILKVQLLNHNNPIDPKSEFVSQSLRNTTSCQLRLWNIKKYKKDMRRLISKVKYEELLNQVTNDLISFDSESEESFKEGKPSKQLVNKYERDPKLRTKAISIHGTTCMACGFNFNQKYGEHGKNYIEVHHIVPLSQIKKSILINPETDMVVLCSNCHRMIHRNRNKPLNLERLIQLIKYPVT